MPTPHTCHVDCKLVIEDGRTTHGMYATMPTSASGRYQWEINQKIFRMGHGARKAWRATGQDESRACREWNVRRPWEPRGERGLRKLAQAVEDAYLKDMMSEFDHELPGQDDYLKDVNPFTD